MRATSCVGHHPGDIMRVGDMDGRLTMRARSIEAGQVVPGARSALAGVLSALILGIFVVFTVGFAGASVLHEAAHNTRHSIAFPCH
jgi:hypothetical protein